MSEVIYISDKKPTESYWQVWNADYKYELMAIIDDWDLEDNALIELLESYIELRNTNLNDKIQEIKSRYWASLQYEAEMHADQYIESTMPEQEPF